MKSRYWHLMLDNYIYRYKQKNLNKMKKTIIILVVAFLSLAVGFIYLSRQKNAEEVKNQKIDFTQRIEKLECEENFSISELTHYGVINEIQKELSDGNKKVWLGNDQHTYIGVNYNTDGKQVYWVSRSDKSFFEIRIFDMEVAPGGYTAKFLSVSVICK